MLLLLTTLYLVAITAANLITTHFAGQGHPEASIYTAFALVAFDMVARDRMHDLLPERGRRWAFLGVLIAVGSLISYVINADAATIAIASCVAFAAAFTVDSIVYELAHRWAWLERSNASNIAAALVDSAVFVALAFPGFLFVVAFGQFTAKVAGGLVFSLMLSRRVVPQGA